MVLPENDRYIAELMYFEFNVEFHSKGLIKDSFERSPYKINIKKINEHNKVLIYLLVADKLRMCLVR